MNYKIVSDSSSNLLTLPGVNFSSIPMKVNAGEKEFVDDQALNVAEMVEYLRSYKGKSGSACPSLGEWLDAFGDAENIFCATISRNLSGSYNAACQAAKEYMQEHPGRRVHVFDTLSAGPEQAMLLDKIAQLVTEGNDFDTVVAKATEYQDSTHILFCLESLNNLARNGRVNPAAAKIAGILGIRACGEAQSGQIIPLHKPRGGKKATQVLVDMIRERGFYDGALLRIAHCFGEAQAQALADALREEFPNMRFILEPTKALCSFYAEVGGLMIGIEGAFNKMNNSKLS